MKRFLTAASALLLSLGVAGCEIIEGIFQVGFWLGVVLVVVVIVVIWVVWKMFD